MKSIFLFCVGILFVINGAADETLRNSRISSGEPIQITDAKYQVAVTQPNSEGYYALRCSGALLKNDLVVTAASCVYDNADAIITNLKICAGDTYYPELIKGHCSETKKITPHHLYSFTTEEGPKYDIALIKLKSQFPSFDKIGVVALASASFSPGTKCRVTGWGSSNSGSNTINVQLRRGFVSIDDKTLCNKDHPIELHTSLLCTTGTNDPGTAPCNGDAGAPLVCEDKLAGVSSEGLCGRYPAIYTDISQFTKWIQENGSHRPGTSLLLTVFLIIITVGMQSLGITF